MGADCDQVANLFPQWRQAQLVWYALCVAALFWFVKAEAGQQRAVMRSWGRVLHGGKLNTAQFIPYEKK